MQRNSEAKHKTNSSITYRLEISFERNGPFNVVANSKEKYQDSYEQQYLQEQLLYLK